MPSFAGLLDDGEIQSLTAYVRSLGSEKAGAVTEQQND
jgi:mono/diheme cytochrome c family protein